jgi:hypothetical protein
VLRFDPFSMGAPYHIRPGLAPQIPLPMAEGQSPVDAVLAFFEKPLRFRGLIALAEEGGVARASTTASSQTPPNRYVARQSYVDRLLKGARLADIPIEQEREFELLITAHCLSRLCP